MLSARPPPPSRPPKRPAAFHKLSRHPLPQMSRTAVNKTTGHAPSTLMLERMQEAASDLAILATTTQGWRFANERNGAMVYDMVGRKLPPNVTTARKFGRGAGHSSDYYLVRAVTTVHTDVAAMLELLHSSTTDEFRLVMKQVFLQYFQNGVTLDKLTCTTPPPFAADPDAGAEGARRSYSEDDSYSVNWLTLKAQAKLGDVENHRDFTLVCYQDAFSRHDSGALERVGRGTARARSSTSNLQPQSKLVGVHVLSSVNFQAVPELPIPECTDRLHFRNSGFVVEETSEPNVLRLSLLLSLLPTKATLKHARKYQRWLQALASCVGNLSKVLRPEVTLHCLSRLTWKQSDHCFMCLKMFRTFRRCHHCRFCGESVCSTCSSMINMAGYEIYDGSGKTLAAGATGGLLSSQCEESSAAEYSRVGDVWQTTPGDEMNASRSITGTRSLREARGCNVCVSDLRHGLTTPAIVTMRQNTELGNCSSVNVNSYNGGNSLHARAKNRLSASNDEDEVVPYDSLDDVIYERRLGSIATYIPSIDGVGTIVENDGPFTASSLGLNESIDEFMVTPEELQDKFPAVNEPALLRFRTTSDPDQLRRMRNVSDPDLPQQLKDKHSMVSMSTASSSFSRSSNDTASQYLRNTNLSAMSDEYSACDLSRDPDILALAGLKPRPSDDQYENALRQQPLMPCKTDREQLYVQEEGDTAKSVEVVSTAQRHEREIAAIEETFPTSWPGTSAADARMCVSSTSACGGLAVPQHGNYVRSDVLRYRSQTTAASSWIPAATAPFPIKSQTSNCEAKHITFASSGFLPGLDHYNQEPGSTCAAGSANGSDFHFRRTNSEPAVESSDLDVSRMKSEPPNTPAAIEAAAVTASTESTSYAVGTRQVQHLSASSSSKASVATEARRGSVPLPMHHMNRLPASIPECSTASEESNRNDMILLPVSKKSPADFVVFSDSRRESIFMRADDGQDLIPLEF